MLTLLFLAAAAAESVALVPSVSGVNVVRQGSGGSCFAGTLEAAAAIDVNWTVTNPDDVLYEAQLFENDILVATQTTNNTYWLKEVTEHVEEGPYNTWTSNWTYRVDIVRKADGVVVSTASSSPWVQEYGTCTDSAGGGA